MAIKTKKLKERYGKLPGAGPFVPDEALKLVKQVCEEVKMDFDETVEAVFRLGIDPKKPEQAVRGTFTLPHGTGKVPRILVFGQGDKVREALDAGADFAGGDDMAAKIKEGWTDFDVAIATPDMMRVVGQLGKILGPRGLMPNPKTGTVTFAVKETIEEFKKGKVEYRNDQYGNVAVPIGRISFDVEKLVENFKSLHSTLLKAKPSAAKGQYVRGAAVSATQGPGLKIDINALAR